MNNLEFWKNVVYDLFTKISKLIFKKKSKKNIL